MTQPEDMTHPGDGATPPWGTADDRGGQQLPVAAPDARGQTCPVCGGGSFRDEEGRMQTRWGMSSHIFTIHICTSCGHAMLFYQGGGMAM